jgi:hypothetical protein
MERHRPATWCKMFGTSVMDPDGWREDGTSFYKPLTKLDFIKRFQKSITRFPKDPEKRDLLEEADKEYEEYIMNKKAAS